MRPHLPTADIFVPDGEPLPGALARATHLGIGAHQDDLEFMAFHGIAECFHHDGARWFAGVTCTDGAGSSRTGRYARSTDAEMRHTRLREQRAAAAVGRYGAMLQLGYTSAEVRDPADRRLAADLREIIRQAAPRVVYTHNLADKHDSHIGVAAAVLHAIRDLPATERPARLLGCEVWRGLDWLGDGEKVALDVSGHDHLAAALAGTFDSQIAGGKRYDLATLGRRSANATFFDSHTADTASQLCFAMDLTPLIADDTLDPAAFALAAIDRFRADVRLRLAAHFPPAS